MLNKILDCLLPSNCLACQMHAQTALHLCEHCWQQLPFQHSHNYYHAAFHYKQPINYFLLQLKFHHQLIYAQWLAKWFLACFNSEIPEAILPVPLHTQRLRQRGFNQALEIAKPIAKYFNIPLLHNHVLRYKNTLPQTELTPAQRKLNLENAFQLTMPINFSRIAIFDDVITTGNTLDALKNCLPKHIIVDYWAIAGG